MTGMLKAKVIVRFRDKESGKVFEAGDTFEGEEKRVKGLQRLGYIGEIDKAEPDTDQRLSGNVEEVKQVLDGLEKAELEKLLQEEIDSKNRKGVIDFIEQLLSVQNESE